MDECWDRCGRRLEYRVVEEVQRDAERGEAVVDDLHAETQLVLTGALLDHTALTPNIALRNAIEEWRVQRFKVVQRSDFQIGEQIARGSFKVVHRATLRGQPVAAAKMRSGCEEEAVKLVSLGRHPSYRSCHYCDSFHSSHSWNKDGGESAIEGAGEA